MSEEIKGAFKNHPPEQQPVRIPVYYIPELERKLKEHFSTLGDLYFPKSLKFAGKSSTGDLDVIFVPKVENWKDVIKKHPCTVASISSSEQLMTVMKLLDNGEKYMIDFLRVKTGGLRFKQMFYGYGTSFSAMLGSFSRSIGYKFTDYALYKRVKDGRGQWHNIFLTSSPDKALRILGLDPTFLDCEAIFTSEGVASWIVSSPRFDSNMWKYGNPDKIAVGIPLNRNARDAIKKKKDDVSDTYELVSLIEKRGEVVVEYTYEQHVLGEEFVNKIKRKINKKVVNTEIILNGQEIMELLQVKPGPVIGLVQKCLAEYFSDVPKEQRATPEIKEAAKKLLVEHREELLKT